VTIQTLKEQQKQQQQQQQQQQQHHHHHQPLVEICSQSHDNLRMTRLAPQLAFFAVGHTPKEHAVHFS